MAHAVISLGIRQSSAERKVKGRASLSQGKAARSVRGRALSLAMPPSNQPQTHCGGPVAASVSVKGKARDAGPTEG